MSYGNVSYDVLFCEDIDTLLGIDVFEELVITNMWNGWKMPDKVPLGPIGHTGPSGRTGPTGLTGARYGDRKGDDGADGPEGSRLIAPTGPRGLGLTGPTGPISVSGFRGPTGPNGLSITGPTGSGPTGHRGNTGLQNFTLTGTSNQIVTTHAGNGIFSVTIPQNISTTSSPQFGSLYLGSTGSPPTVSGGNIAVESTIRFGDGFTATNVSLLGLSNPLKNISNFSTGNNLSMNQTTLALQLSRTPTFSTISFAPEDGSLSQVLMLKFIIDFSTNLPNIPVVKVKVQSQIIGKTCLLLIAPAKLEVSGAQFSIRATLPGNIPVPSYSSVDSSFSINVLDGSLGILTLSNNRVISIVPAQLPQLFNGKGGWSRPIYITYPF
jgi:hypothetical protein